MARGWRLVVGGSRLDGIALVAERFPERGSRRVYPRDGARVAERTIYNYGRFARSRRLLGPSFSLICYRVVPCCRRYAVTETVFEFDCCPEPTPNC